MGDSLEKLGVGNGTEFFWKERGLKRLACVWKPPYRWCGSKRSGREWSGQECWGVVGWKLGG